MIETADLFGYAGTVTGISFLIPQVYKTYRSKSVEDLSWGMLGIFFLNCILWSIYGFLTGALPVILVNVISLAVNGTLIVLKVRYRNNP